MEFILGTNVISTGPFKPNQKWLIHGL